MQAPARVDQERAAHAAPPAPIDALYRAHADRVFRAAWRVTGSPSDAEDVLQTVFLRLLRHDRLPDPGAGAASYLSRAAVNAAIDVVRARGGLVPLPADVADGSPGSPDRAHAGDELVRALRAALARLEPRHAEMFALRYFEGLALADIARAMGTSSGVVAVTLFRTRNRLKKELRSFTGGER